MPALSRLQSGLSAWAWEPAVIVPLLLAALLYGWGTPAAVGVRAWQRRCFWTGWAVLAVALLSPLHPLGQVLFWAHMAQHELLMVVAAPLLVLGRPAVVWVWAMPPRWRPLAGPLFRRMPGQAASFVIHLLAIWVWHVPAAYQAALGNEGLHIAQHVSFLGSALLFWWAVFATRGMTSLLSVFGTALHTSLLGALLTFSSTPWYSAYTAAPEWGLTPLEDQQLGGLLMWIPPGFVYVGVFAAVFYRRLQAVAVVAALLLAGCGQRSDGRDEKARGLLLRYGCQTCHTIPGVPGASGTVGPPLTAIGRRTYLAGRITNEPENLIRWISDPKSVDPQTAMPKTGITPEEARQVAVYLYSLR